MVSVKGNKAPGKKSTRNLEVVFKKGSTLFWGVPFIINVVYAAGDSFLFC